MKVLIIHNDDTREHVRGRKFIAYFLSQGYDYHLYFWRRITKPDVPDSRATVLLNGGGYGTSKLAFFYLIWVVKVFFHFAFKKTFKKEVFFVIDFDSALPIFFVSLFRRRVTYLYDIHDDFALRYNWGRFLKSLISSIDRQIKKRAFRVIHVDENRVRPEESNYIIIRNTPSDYILGSLPEKNVSRHTFVSSGLLSAGRGMMSIARFATCTPNFNFIFAGKVPDNEDYSELFLLPNCTYLGFIDQESLFKQIYGSSGIFSLYDPRLEINKRAASNKLYDAMMLGIPVISNYGLMAEQFIMENEVGVCVSYEFDESWNILKSDHFLNNIDRIGLKGREVYKRQFSYKENFEVKLNALFSELSKLDSM